MEFREKKRWGFFGLPFTFTTYMVTEELITVEEGFINKRENDCYIYKVQDVELIRTLGERMFGLGTVKCYTGDTTNPELYLTHIKNAKNIQCSGAGLCGYRCWMWRGGRVGRDPFRWFWRRRCGEQGPGN